MDENQINIDRVAWGKFMRRIIDGEFFEQRDADDNFVRFVDPEEITLTGFYFKDEEE